ncbi:MAG: tetratricopeptide repeat protein [Candidatus Pacebacteria bacterium]|jgi:tetratricopeptide (TPR) repeat protein|nr:tetratricopeptide repeat protein [Candidatus Paceibacterota bacterium]MDD2757022.1 tetratricopeptide repeat protein [Candidatus Paceibacterota bacterium]MDD3969612.1 tetratricopeptide repeat protein [Candidatus Paceibacterota bacterium]
MTKYIYSFFLFLLPLFLITQTSLVNTIFVIAFAFSLLLFSFFKPQKIIYNKLVLLFFSSFLLSFIFSKNIYFSLWGKGAESLFAFISIFVIFSYFKKEYFGEIFKFFVLGNIIAVIYFFIQSFIGNEVLNISQLSIITALSLLFLIPQYRDKRIIAPIILFFVFLIFVDIKIAWFILSIGTFLIFYKKLVNCNFEIKKTIPLLFILIAFLICFLIPIPSSETKEVGNISYNQSISIARGSLTESAKNLFFGSGPSTYHYQFSLYKDKEINLTNPYLVAREGSSMILTFIVTLGLLGIISLLILLSFFYFEGFKNFLKEDDIIFPMAFSFSLLFFFGAIDIFIILIFFILFNSWINKRKEIKIDKAIIVALLIIFVFAGFNYFNYIKADNHYNRSLEYFLSGELLGKSINEMEKSIQSFEIGDYYIALSKLYLLNASQYFEERWVTQEKINEQRNMIEENISLSEKYAKKAIEIDKNNFQSWQKLGFLYENINFLEEEKTEDIIYNYQEAKKLAPQNYDIYYALGRAFEESGEKELALEEYKKALELNPNDNELFNKIELWKE